MTEHGDGYLDWHGAALVCRRCAALVVDVAAHDGFHRRLRASEPPLMAILDLLDPAEEGS